MSIFCSIDTYLKVKFNEENVRKLLERLQNLDCLFVNLDLGINITIEDAAKVLFRTYNNPDEGLALGIRYKSTFFDVFIKKVGVDFLGVDFLLSASRWRIQYDSGPYDLDMGRYVNAVIEILKPFEMTKMSYQIVY
jgi:hypothetical protein